MNPVLRNTLAVVAAWAIGSGVNMSLIHLSPIVIPLPEGIDPSNMESLAQNIHRFEPRHFVMPFLAHAMGTLVGAFVAAKTAATRKLQMAMIIGFLFLAGGIAMAALLPSPNWQKATDILLAYIPMAMIGAKLARTEEQSVKPAPKP